MQATAGSAASGFSKSPVAQVLLYSCILTLYGLQQFGVPKVDLCRVLQQLYLIC